TMIRNSYRYRRTGHGRQVGRSRRHCLEAPIGSQYPPHELQSVRISVFLSIDDAFLIEPVDPYATAAVCDPQFAVITSGERDANVYDPVFFIAEECEITGFAQI